MADKSQIGEEFLELLCKATGEAVIKASELHFDKRNSQHLFATCLYGSVLELITACLTLTRERQTGAVLILLKSLLEAYADLLNVIRDKAYFRRMAATGVQQRIKLYKAALRNMTNPFLQGIVASVPADKQKDLERQIGQYRARNEGPLGVWERFTLAGMNDEYQSIYWSLCLYAHHDIAALEERHIEGQNGNFRVVFFKGKELGNFLEYLHLLSVCLTDSSIKIHKLLNSKAEREIQELKEGLAAVNKKAAEALRESQGRA